MKLTHIGTLFNRYPVNFPLDNRITVLIGHNGSGKTKTLETLQGYFEDKNEEVVFLREYRFLFFNKEELDGLKIILDLQGIEYDKEWFNVEHYDIKKGDRINCGKLQILNFIYVASIMTDGNLLIDFPEINLDLRTQGKLISILSQTNLKRIVIATHSPMILSEDRDYAIDIKKIVNLNG